MKAGVSTSIASPRLAGAGDIGDIGPALRAIERRIRSGNEYGIAGSMNHSRMRAPSGPQFPCSRDRGAFVLVPGPNYDWDRSPRTLRLVRDVGPGAGLPGFFSNSIREPSAKVNSTINGLLLDTFADVIF